MSTPDALSGWPPPVLDPAGPAAAPVTLLAWALLGVFALVMGVVIVALILGVWGGERWKRRLGGVRLVWIGGLAFPVIVLSALLVWGLGLTSSLSSRITGEEPRIRVVGEMWWWRVSYLDGNGSEIIQSANELRIPVGEPVVLELQSADVIHSFWVPRLSGKLDLIPGRTNLLRLQADEPGQFGGQCAEYCGGPHALMGFVVIAMPRAEYDLWLAESRGPAASPADAQALRGMQVFEASGCGACHAVRGTPSNGAAGPDLTRIGERVTIGAGILPNNRGTLAAWVADSQTIKPGNRMPSYETLSGDELQDLSAYLESLQ